FVYFIVLATTKCRQSLRRVIVFCLFSRDFHASTTDYSTISDSENSVSICTFFIIAMFVTRDCFITASA
ncbi:MAG TPA: hypothetical protein PK230_13465, partial [Chitinophagales bacterium]|nr:hypothetical protein [Chitinophagales bacterium]